jgi:quercetin dioxygenase-like cupin family protein
MGVQRVELGQGDRRRARVEGGPSAEVLIGQDPGDALGAAHVIVPPGAGMPAHDHGASETLLIALAGRVRLADADEGGASIDVEPGVLGVIPTDHRVVLRNDGDEEARLLVIFSPADFATRLRAWPPAAGTAAGG